MTKNEIDILVDTLNHYTKLYDEGRPLISDKEWDNLYFKLLQAENKTGYINPNSPTKTINYQVVNKLKKVEHNHPMLSLDKTKDIETLKSFTGESDWIAMCKMDGLTCSLHYINGKLVSAETRGNGAIGEDILHNALTITSIPKQINYLDDLIVDGEVICTIPNFEPFKEEYKNPRNFASGSIRLLNARESATRKLDFVAWDVINGLNEEQTLSAKLLRLALLGFTIVPRIIKDDSITIDEAVTELKERAKDLYPIDGIVLKYDNINEYISKGRTDHHFRGGLAFKFYDDEYSTTLQDIEFSMGKTGVLTPIAIFNPVDINGSTVSRASLHNLSIMHDILGEPYKDEPINVIKANDIIPQITSATKRDKSTNLIKIITTCPICGAPLTIKHDGIADNLYCENPNCEGRLINRLEHFCGKKGLDIKGLSKATLTKLIEWNWVNSFVDIYKLQEHSEEWINKPGFGAQSVKNILDSIEKSKDVELWKIIAAASIPNIGGVAAKTLAKHFITYNDFRTAVDKNFDFTELADFGDTMRWNIINYDYIDLDNVVSFALHIKEPAAAAVSVMSLDKMQFCITGKVTHFKNRDELKAKIESLGGKVTSSVTKKTNYLINNDINSTSSKNKTAKELNIQIITEEDFLKMIT